jgi:cell division protease FtsH
VDLDRLAQRTVGFTGADLENLLNESAICALRNNRKVITWEDIDEGFNRVIVGMKKVRNPMTDEEKRIVAFHEAGHAVVTRLMAKHPVEKVTIAPTGKALGYVLKTPQEFHLRSKQQLFNEICITLGGRVAEEIMFGKENITNGATQDIKQATQIAYEMIFSYGMSELGPLALDTNAEDMWLRVSDDVKNKAFAEMQALLDRAQTETHEFLQENIDSLKRLAFKLMEVETIDGKDLDKVLNPEPNSQNIIILEGGEEISEEKVVV